MANISRSSSIITDSNLTPFLSPHFSPIEYLNRTLPSATSANHNHPTKSTSTSPSFSPPLPTLLSQTQTQISALAAQTSRLTETLNALTDDILRVSPRLSYEVEILRGEAVSLSESLSPSGHLHALIAQFVSDASASPLSPVPPSTTPQAQPPNPPPPQSAPLDPLRTLLHVRARLTHVSEMFSLALSWPFPPSLLPQKPPIFTSHTHTHEAQGQAACARLRQEILDLCAETGVHDEGLSKAGERVRELRACVEVWKGTGEEKARGKFVDELEIMVLDEARRKKQESDSSANAILNPAMSETVSAPTTTTTTTTSGPTPGFLRNLQRLRDEIYMD